MWQVSLSHESAVVSSLGWTLLLSLSIVRVRGLGEPRLRGWFVRGGTCGRGFGRAVLQAVTWSQRAFLILPARSAPVGMGWTADLEVDREGRICANRFGRAHLLGVSWNRGACWTLAVKGWEDDGREGTKRKSREEDRQDSSDGSPVASIGVSGGLHGGNQVGWAAKDAVDDWRRE